MLFYQPRWCSDNVDNVDWLEELDLKRALRRLDTVYGSPNPEGEPTSSVTTQGTRSTPTAAVAAVNSIYEVLQQQGPTTPSLWAPLEISTIVQAMKMHGGPIPGFDASKLHADSAGFSSSTGTPERLVVPGPNVSTTHGPSIMSKKRGHSHDSRSVSPASSERSATASPSSTTGAGSKKPKSHSIVHSTYYASR